MIQAQKPDHFSLKKLIDRLKEGRFVIPDFQRAFEWKPWDIKELIKSIFLDYYIGSLLIWKGKKDNYEALSCEIIYGYNNIIEPTSWNYQSGKPDHIVLDGQQRLTAIYYAIVSPDVNLPQRAKKAIYYIDIKKYFNEEYDEAFQYEWLSIRLKEKLENVKLQYEEDFFPISLLNKSDNFELFEWLTGYEKYWENEKRNSEKSTNEISEEVNEEMSLTEKIKMIKEFKKTIINILTSYQISYIELDEELGIEKVCDIFTQINSRGIKLDVFDLIKRIPRRSASG